MRSITVFCGSADGYNEYYREMAYQVGETLAARRISIIYGGAKVGLNNTFPRTVILLLHCATASSIMRQCA